MAGRRLDLSLYLVTDTRLCGERGVVETVAQAVANGVTVVQLRDPEASARELVHLGRRLRAVLADSGVPLLVNDRADIAFAVPADGVHLGQGDLPPTEARRLLGAQAVVGLSITADAQIDGVPALPAGSVDYLGVGPVFAQDTKPDAAPAIGLAGLAAAVVKSPLPCVAIGGVNASNLADVLATGAAGVAVVSAICDSDDPGAAARELRAVQQSRESE